MSSDDREFDDAPANNNFLSEDEDNNVPDDRDEVEDELDVRSSPVHERVLSEEEGEDLFGDNFENDYQHIPELDQYNQKYLDNSEQSELSIGTLHLESFSFVFFEFYHIFFLSTGDRLQVEEQLRRRDKDENRLQGRRRKGYDLFDQDSSEPDFSALKKRREYIEKASRKQVGQSIICVI